MQNALADSLHNVYMVVAALTFLVFLAVLFFPKGRAQDLAVGEEASPQAQPVPPSPTVRGGVPTSG